MFIDDTSLPCLQNNILMEFVSTPDLNGAVHAPRHFNDDPVPEWIVLRLQNLEGNPPHYEASFRGPHNALLNSYFPAKNKFLVKTETRLRQAVTDDDPAPANARTSIDSQNTPVHNRPDDIIPDFVVCSASEDLHGDFPLLIWELKISPSVQHAEQFERYEAWAVKFLAQRAYLSLNLACVRVCLVEGNFITVYVIDPSSFAEPLLAFIPIMYLHILSLSLHNMLLSLAHGTDV